jgi:energy-coupling factor transporter ATP-binding protein EcfA2
MFFRVENLGPLREAELDLSKELILLTGPNSTGKTYAAWSVYGLFRSRIASAPLQPVVDEILASPKLSVGFDRVAALWPSVIEATAGQLASRIHLCFASERHHFANVKVALRAGPDEPSIGGGRPRTFQFPVREVLVRVSVGAQVRIQFFKLPDPAGQQPPPGDLERIALAHVPRYVKATLAKSLAWALKCHPAVRSSIWPKCTLLPTDRSGVDMFAKELSLHRTELVDRAVEAELDAQPEPTSIARNVGRYPWPIQDSLRMANDLVFLAKNTSGFADLAVEIETLLGGSVDLSKEGEFSFKPEGASSALGIHLTSSMVKSLVGLVFFFRHLAKKGDLLMIDEPELNLHPDNQRKIARVLVKAVNRGLRMIMSTHSDYLLRELNNLILISRDTKPVRDLRAELHYTDAELLDRFKLGVYVFKDGKAEAADVTEEGFEASTIEDEIRKMNAVSQRLYGALYE